MNKKQLTKPALIAAADEVSKMFDDPICAIGKRTTKQQLTDALLEASSDFQPDDEFSDDCRAVLELIGVVFMKNIPIITTIDKPIEIDKPVTTTILRKGNIKERNKYIEELISAGKYTAIQITERTSQKYPDHSRGGISTVICDGKNAKYNKYFPLLVRMDSNKILSF